jgi:glycine cleavage system H protein
MNDELSNLRFTPTHEWLAIDGADMMVGISDHAQAQLGDMVFIELPQIGIEVQAGDELGVLESVKAASDFYAPISGIVVAVNNEVVAHPERLNTDPYGAWLVKIRAHDIDDIQNLQDVDAYHHQIARDH